KSGQKGNGVVIAYDTRFLSEKFASEGAKIIAFNGIQAYLCTRDVPTPCASFETVRRKAMGAINFTASHNPPEYNGLKFSTSNGAPALPEITKAIEEEIHTVQLTKERLDVYEKSELIENIDPNDRYLAELRNKVDVERMRKRGLPLYETPVGFKYIGELILEDKIALGGEESAGMSMYRHLPEKDGILACLLVAEMVARTGKKLNELIDDVYNEFGFFYSKRA